MYEIKFEPYIGENYNDQKFKVLILGESHYFNQKDYKSYLNDDNAFKSVTNDVVNRFLNYKKGITGYERWMNTFTKFSNVINGKRIGNKETVRYWDSCIFYNYVQKPTTGPRRSPLKEDFIKSFNALSSVLKKHKPDIIFIWGYRLSGNLPKETIREQLIKKSKVETLDLNLKIPFYVVPHPSSSKFNYSLHSYLCDYIEKVKTL